MRRKTTKTMAALLGATLIASAFTGCGQDAQQQTSQETKTETKQESQAGEAKASESEEKQETAKWSGTITLSPYMFGPVENDKITPLIEEKLKEYGYDVKFENIYVETGQYAELVNLRLASGEAPDIFRVTDVDTYMGYCKQGLVATWDEALFREQHRT